jgi:hypothetical protein
MQHLHNAMVLYLLAVNLSMKFDDENGRWKNTSMQEGLDDLVRGHADFNKLLIDKTNVPRGAMTFLNQADVEALIALYLHLRPHPHDVFKQMNEADLRTEGRQLIIGTPYKFDLTNPEVTDERKNTLKMVIRYLEVLYSYWHDNHAMGRLRRRMHVRAKLVNPGAAVVGAGNTMQHVKTDGFTYNLLEPYGWKDAALYGLVFMHVKALEARP